MATNRRAFERVAGGKVKLTSQPSAKIGYEFTVLGRIRQRIARSRVICILRTLS